MTAKKKATKKKATKNLITKASEAQQPYTVPAGKVLVMRCCRADMISHNGFVWPTEGEAFAPDFKPIAECGHGLHGWLWGEGDITAAGEVASQPDAKWLAVEVNADAIINLGGKVKFERGIVRQVGTAHEIAALMQTFALGKAIIMGTATAGYAGTATAGDAGTATAGDAGTATAGYAGTATAGDAGTATAGARGTATAGYAGTATAGDAGTATAGARGTATAGARGTLLIKRWDDKLLRYRWVQGEVGIDGIEANVPYKLDEAGKLVKVK